MMDELELLKKDWKNKEEHLPKLSFDEIYKMIWKKSSSIVKWIFYISIAEFLFWITILFIHLNSEEIHGKGAKLMQIIENILDIGFFLVMIYFIYKFYQNYKKISATDSAKKLMTTIIKTRKTVMKYVWFNLGFFAVTMIAVFIEISVFNPPKEITDQLTNSSSAVIFWITVSFIFLLIIIFFSILFWFFYKLL